MESELKKIQDIAIKAYNGVMEDREADEAIREILAKYGIPKEKSKNVTAEQLYSTRLVHAERDTKDGKTQKCKDKCRELSCGGMEQGLSLCFAG